MRTFARVAVAGFVGVTLLKLFTTVLIPMLGMLLGLMALTMKLAVIAAVVYFVWSMVRPPASRSGDPSEAEMKDKVEIVVEEEPDTPSEGE